MRRLAKLLSPLLALALLTPAAHAAIKSETITYHHGDAELQGYLAYDDAISGKRPGVLVVHEWWGLNEYAKKRADMLAEMGYVAFAADMYGKGLVTTHAKEAKGWMEQVTSNVENWRARAVSGLEVLKNHPLVDSHKLAAIGYCFGGGTVMQLAYSGADLAGVASFHGPLPPPPETVTAIKPKVFVAHGNADGFVPPERIAAFRAGMERLGADWFMLVLGGAKHSFTNPEADQAGMDGLAYNAAADRRSWAMLKEFFSEIFPPQP